MKNRKFATTLLTTALLTYTPGHLLFPLRGNSPCGFSLETDAEPQAEEQYHNEVSATTKETKTQDLGQIKHKTGQRSPQKAAVSPSELPEEQTPLEESEEQTQDPFNESGEQPSTSESQEQAPPKSGKRHIKTGQPSHENAPTSHSKPPREQPSPLSEELNTAEQDTQPSEDILLKILNNTYEFCGDEVIYTETAIIYITFPTADEMKPVYVNGFGWVEPSNEPSIRILLLAMMENGIKVGIMGG